MNNDQSLSAGAAAAVPEPTNSSFNKGKWSDDEHDRLVQAIETYGTADSHAWRKIQRTVRTRDVKQIKERFRLKVDNSFTSKEWTRQEDEVLLARVQEFGQKWAQICRELPGRNENAVKTRFHALRRKESKVWTQEEDNLLRELLRPEAQISMDDILLRFPRKTQSMILTRRDYFLMQETADAIKRKMEQDNVLEESQLKQATATITHPQQQQQQQFQVQASPTNRRFQAPIPPRSASITSLDSSPARFSPGGYLNPMYYSPMQYSATTPISFPQLDESILSALRGVNSTSATATALMGNAAVGAAPFVRNLYHDFDAVAEADEDERSNNNKRARLN